MLKVTDINIAETIEEKATNCESKISIKQRPGAKSNHPSGLPRAMLTRGKKDVLVREIFFLHFKNCSLYHVAINFIMLQNLIV